MPCEYGDLIIADYRTLSSQISFPHTLTPHSPYYHQPPHTVIAMKYITIALALIASSRSILAQPARIVPDILDVVVDPESVVAPVPAPLLDAEEQHHKKAMASFIIASKLKSRQASRSQIIARHQAKQKREAPVLPEGPKCDGVLLAYFPTVSWKTPTQNKVCTLLSPS